MTAIKNREVTKDEEDGNMTNYWRKFIEERNRSYIVQKLEVKCSDDVNEVEVWEARGEKKGERRIKGHPVGLQGKE